MIGPGGGPLPEAPGYTFPRDTNQSMLAQIEKHALAIPGPDEHHKELTWKAIGASFGAGADPKKGRVTFCDEAMR